jgi:hypothetical protein
LKDLWCGLLWVEDVVAVGARWAVAWARGGQWCGLLWVEDVVASGGCGAWSFFYFLFIFFLHRTKHRKIFFGAFFKMQLNTGKYTIFPEIICI